jgi:hypothetical protein
VSAQLPLYSIESYGDPVEVRHGFGTRQSQNGELDDKTLLATVAQLE